MTLIKNGVYYYQRELGIVKSQKLTASTVVRIMRASFANCLWCFYFQMIMMENLYCYQTANHNEAGKSHFYNNSCEQFYRIVSQICPVTTITVFILSCNLFFFGEKIG